MRCGACEHLELVRRHRMRERHAACRREAGWGMRGRWREARVGGAQCRCAGDSTQARVGGRVDGSVGRLTDWFDLWVQVMDQYPM
jgi:hypothetical protein